MSLESVFENCIKHMDNEERESKKDLIILEIEKETKRFERALYTYTFGGGSMFMWKMIARDGQAPSEVKRAFFERNKREYAHKYLEMLCDLYDYQPTNKKGK